MTIRDRHGFELHPVSEIRQDDTNPKYLIGVTKVQLGLLPAAGVIYGALSMQDGADKYGPYNWRGIMAQTQKERSLQAVAATDQHTHIEWRIVE